MSWRSWTVSDAHLVGGHRDAPFGPGGTIVAHLLGPTRFSAEEGGTGGPSVARLVVGPGRTFNLGLTYVGHSCPPDPEAGTGPASLPSRPVTVIADVATSLGTRTVRQTIPVFCES